MQPCLDIQKTAPGALGVGSHARLTNQRLRLGNLANLSLLSPAIPGPKECLARRPRLLLTVIFVQIVVSLVLLGVLARRDTTEPSVARDPERSVPPAMPS